MYSTSLTFTSALINSSTCCNWCCMAEFKTGIKTFCNGWRTLIFTFLRSDNTSEEYILRQLHSFFQGLIYHCFVQLPENRYDERH